MNSDTGKKNKCVYNIKTNLKNNMRLGLWSVSLRWDHGYFFYFIRGVKVSEFLNQYIIIKAFLQSQGGQVPPLAPCSVTKQRNFIWGGHN